MANKKKKAGDGQLLGPVTHIKANASDTKALNNKAPSILTRQTQPSKNTVALSPMNHLRNETKTSTQMYSGKGNTKTRDVTKVRGQTTTQSTSSKGSKSSKSSKTKTKAGDGQKLGSVYHISGAKTDRDKRMMNAALSGKNTSAPSYMLSDKGKRKKEEADAAQTNNPMGRLQRHAYRTQTSTQDNYLQSEADTKLDSKTLSGLRKKSKETGGTTKLSRFDDRWLPDDQKKSMQTLKDAWAAGQGLIDRGHKKEGQQLQAEAHKQAEALRDAYGYSGGASGSDFRTGEWADTERIDGSTMTAEGRQALRAAKSAYNRAKKAGDTKAMQEAAKAGQDARNNAENYDPERVKAYRDSLGEKQPRQNTDAYGRSIYTPTKTQQEHDELWGTAFKEGILGGFQTLLDTAAKATHNAIQNRYDPAYQSRQFTARELQRKAEGRLSEREKQILEAQAARANKDKFEAYQDADSLIEKIKLGGVYEKAINDYVREHTPDDREKIRLAAEAAKMRTEAKEVKHDEGLNTENSVGMRHLQRANEATQALVDAAKTPVGKFATKAGLSMLQMAPFLAANVIPGAGQAISLGGMSALAAGQKAGELQADPKVSAQEALGRGLISGGIEAFTEKISLDRLLNLIRKGGGTSFIKAVAKQAGVEASEESASYALNYLADKAAQDPKAKFSLQDLAENAMIGAVSGAAFGAGGHFMGDALAGGTRSTRTTPTLDETTPSPTPDTETLPTQETAPRPTQEADTAPSDNPLIRAAKAQEDMRTQAQEQAQANQETRNQLLSARERLERAQEAYRQRMQEQETERQLLQNQQQVADESPLLEQQVQNQPEIVGEKPAQPQQRSYDEIPNTFDEYKAQFQDDIDSREMTEGQLLDEYNALKRRNARIQNKQAAQPVQNDATPYNNPGLRDSVGAAREEFDPYSRALNRYGAIEPGENPSRMVDVPRSMTGSDRVRKFARTAMEAGITSDNTVELLQKAVADGEFSYAPKSQKNMVDRAMKALSTPRNAAKAMAQWEQVVNGERVVTDEDVTLGIMMMKAAEQAGDSQTAKQLAAEVAAFGTELGRGVNALRLLKKATPEGKLFYIRKSVDKLNQNIRKRNKGKNKNGDASQTLLNASQRGSQETAVQTLKNDISSAVDQAAKDVSKEVSGERPVRNQTKKAAKDKKQTKQNRENVDLKDWAKETGNDLAKRIASKLNKPQTQRPITRTILSDLMQFAEEHALPKKQQGPKRQAVDRLRDYFANKQFYAEAWVQAQRALREKYAGNQEALDALESFTDSTMDYNADPLHRQNVIINAMMDDIKQTGGLKDYLAREALGAGKQNVNQLANRLIMDTGVSGSDAQVLRSGVEHSFGDMMEDQNGMKLENLIRDALKDNQTTLTEVAKMSPKQKESVGRLISESLQSKYGIEQAYADKVSDTILSEYTEEVATRAREILESKFKPRGQRVTREIQDIIKEYANLGAFSDQAFNELTTSKLFGTEDITVPDDLAQQLVNAKTQEEQDAAIDAIYDYVADRVPKDTVMRMDAWRYFAMLGNPRTHMRNVDGNVLMQGVTRSSNLTSAALQRVLIKDASERTRTGVGTREAHRFAKEDFEKNKDLLSGNSYTSESGEIMRRVREKAFTVDANKKEQSAFWRAVDAAMKPMHKLSDFNTKALDWEDMLFKRVTYIDSMANFLTARGYGKNLDSVPEKVLQEARTHAIDDALEATFQQYSELASKLAQMEASNKAGQFLIGGTFPFKRVPINIAKTAAKFSPAGLVKTITSDAVKLRNGEITAADFCDNLGAGLNGSGLAVLGAFLFANGILSVGESDDDKQAGFDAAMGSQNYAINIGDYSYTIDWAAPSVVPMFIGAEFWNAIKSKDEETGFTKAAMDAVGRMFEPLMQMTMLSGVSSSLKSAAYSQNDPIYAILANVGTNYAGQFVPTLLGQVARTIDPTRRTTFTDANSKVPKPIQQFLQRQGAKIPGLSQKMPEYLDVWGRNDEGSDNVLLRALENFISPGYASKKTGGTMEQELQRLNDAGYEGMLPGAVQKSAKLDGNRMTADQWMKRQKEQGSVSYDILNDFIGTKEYNALTDDQKAKFVEKAYEYAKNSGQAAAGADTSDMAKWYEAANNAPSEGDLSKAEFLSLYAYKSAIEDEAPDEAKASVKQGMWEEYIKSRTDLSEKQRNYVLDNVKFWQMTPADSGAYQKAKNAGYETPEEIQKLLEVKSTFSTDGNTDINNSEMYKGITGYTSDPAEQEKMYNAIKDADATKSWKELAAEQSKQQSVESAAQTALDKALSKDMQAKFAAAMEGAGTKQTDAYRALTGTGASEAECKAYYAYLSAQNGWKKTWEQVKKKAAKGE